MSPRLVDPATGELAPLEEIESAALDYVMLADEIEHDAADLADKRKRLSALASELLDVMTEGEAIEAGPANVVKVPGPRASQRVSRSGCLAFTEQLLGLGLGSMEYQPPGIAEVRRNAARIIAAGIPLERIAPEPMPPPPFLQVVPR